MVVPDTTQAALQLYTILGEADPVVYADQQENELKLILVGPDGSPRSFVLTVERTFAI